MAHIGAVIKKYRCESGLTQKDLACGICSPRYIYLIEKGDRTPSVDVLVGLSDILQVDLFGISHYLGCKDPIDVYETLSLFEKYRRKFDFARLKELTQQKEREKDFRTGLLKFEILLNQAILNIVTEDKIKKAISEFEHQAEPLSREPNFEKTYAQYLAIITMGYLMLGNFEKAEAVINNALKVINAKKSNKFKDVFIVVKLIHMSVIFEEKKYDEVIEEGNWLLDYQMDSSLYDRMEYAYYLLALAYSKKTHREKAMDCAMKVVYIGLLEDIPFAVDQFKKNKEFIDILLSYAPKEGCISRFLEKYHVTESPLT